MPIERAAVADTTRRWIVLALHNRSSPYACISDVIRESTKSIEAHPWSCCITMRGQDVISYGAQSWQIAQNVIESYCIP